MLFPIVNGISKNDIRGLVFAGDLLFNPNVRLILCSRAKSLTAHWKITVANIAKIFIDILVELYPSVDWRIKFFDSEMTFEGFVKSSSLCFDPQLQDELFLHIFDLNSFTIVFKSFPSQHSFPLTPFCNIWKALSVTWTNHRVETVDTAVATDASLYGKINLSRQ